MPEVNKDRTEEEEFSEDLGAADSGFVFSDSPVKVADDSGPVVQEAAPEPEPPAPVVTEPEPATEAEPVAEAEPATDDAAGGEETYTIDMGGERRTVTHAELLSDPTLVAKIVGKSNQVANSQRVGEQRKTELQLAQERLAQAEAQMLQMQGAFAALQQQQQATPQAPYVPEQPASKPLTPKQLATKHAEAIGGLVESGAVSKEMVEELNLTPLLGAYFEERQQAAAQQQQMLHIMAGMAQRLQQTQQAYEGYDQQARRQHATSVREQLIARGGINQRLADDATWTDFLAELNADYPGVRFETDTLERLWVAQNAADIKAAQEAQAQAWNAIAQSRIAQSAGEPASVGGVPPAPQGDYYSDPLGFPGDPTLLI